MREDASHPSVISQGSLECREEFRSRDPGIIPGRYTQAGGAESLSGRRTKDKPGSAEADTVEKFRVRLGFD